MKKWPHLKKFSFVIDNFHVTIILQLEGGQRLLQHQQVAPGRFQDLLVGSSQSFGVSEFDGSQSNLGCDHGL